MSMQVAKQVAKRGTAAAIVAGAAGSSQAESQALGPEQLQEAIGLLGREMTTKGGEQDALIKSYSSDGTPWILPDKEILDNEIFELLELSASVVAEPGVRRTILQKAEERGLALESTRSSSPFSEIIDSGLELRSENEQLRSENEELKRELHSLKVQATADPSRDELHSAEMPPCEAEEAASLPRAQPIAALLNLSVDPSGRVAVKLSPTKPQEEPAKPRKSQRAREQQRQAVVMATAIVVGLLAIAITKNPAGARAAAASAAATVASLMVLSRK